MVLQLELLLLLLHSFTTPDRRRRDDEDGKTTPTTRTIQGQCIIHLSLQSATAPPHLPTPEDATSRFPSSSDVPPCGVFWPNTTHMLPTPAQLHFAFSSSASGVCARNTLSSSSSKKKGTETETPNLQVPLHHPDPGTPLAAAPGAPAAAALGFHLFRSYPSRSLSSGTPQGVGTPPQ